MERTNLKNARKEKGMRQGDFANAMGVNRATVVAWENGTQDPHPDLYPKIRRILGSQDPELFKIFDSQESNQRLLDDFRYLQQESNGGLLDAFQRLLQKSNEGLMDKMRRLIVNTAAKLSGSAVVINTGLVVISSPMLPQVAPEEYIAQCSLILDECQEWLTNGNFRKVERALNTHVPTLTRFANTISPFQGIAASLAVEAKIMQIQLATRNLQFRERERLCAEAVRYGEISGNARLYTTALHWQGNTYVYCYRQPKRAISIFNNALSHIDDDALLSRSGICSLLSIAYAQDNTQENHEIKARDYAELAHMAMPTHPQLDPFYQCVQFGQSELDQQEGKMYLYLAEYFPNSDYAQLAYDAFEQSVSKQAMNQGYLSGSLIKKADAARALGDMRECVKCLTNGFLIAVEIDSLRRFCEADDVISNMPESWQQETAVQDLQKDISHAIVTCR